jgi:large subunit ribosomal protein L19e
MKLRLQRKLAAKLLGVGESRVWLDPTKLKELKDAITSADIAKLISKGVIKALPTKPRKPKKPRRKGPGRRKGGRYARLSKKQRWIAKIRPLRRMLKELRDAGEIDKQTYRKLYSLAKAGTFRDRGHLRLYLEQHGILKRK